MSEEKKYTFEEWKRISDDLSKQLGPEYLQQRTGPGGKKLTYIGGTTVINIANNIFGFNGWSTDIKDVTIDFVDVDDNGRVNIGVAVTVRITLKDGSFHEDQGYGSGINERNKASAFEKARKAAVTDAMKRTLRHFGNALGNCIYDQPYLGGIGKMAKPEIKFMPKNLYRHEQFEAPKPEPPSTPLRTLPEPRQPPPSLHSSVNPRPTPQPPKTTPVHIPPPQARVNHATSSSKNNNNTSSPSAAVAIAEQKRKEEQVELSRKSLMEPIIPEDSFSYEGDDEFLVQMLAADEEMEFHVEDEIENELLAGIITPPPFSSSDPSPQIKREADELSDSTGNALNANKKQKASQ